MLAVETANKLRADLLDSAAAEEANDAARQDAARREQELSNRTLQLEKQLEDAMQAAHSTDSAHRFEKDTLQQQKD